MRGSQLPVLAVTLSYDAHSHRPNAPHMFIPGQRQSKCCKQLACLVCVVTHGSVTHRVAKPAAAQQHAAQPAGQARAGSAFDASADSQATAKDPEPRSRSAVQEVVLASGMGCGAALALQGAPSAPGGLWTTRQVQSYRSGTGSASIDMAFCPDLFMTIQSSVVYECTRYQGDRKVF